MTTKNKTGNGLRYHRGNSGDLIKHGMLAHFVRWWCQKNPQRKEFRFADPFGGIPRAPIGNATIESRLGVLRQQDPYVAECLLDGEDYLNSGLIVAKAAEECGIKPEVWTSDKCSEIHAQLEAEPNLQMLDAKFPGTYDRDNGYSILPHAADFDLVLLDPYCGLLGKDLVQFITALKSVNNNPNVAVMVFVLWNRADRIKWLHRYFTEVHKFEEKAFSLFCPPLLDKPGMQGEKHKECRVKGESSEFAVLLASQMFANGSPELPDALVKFKASVQTALEETDSLLYDVAMWPFK